MKKMNFVYNPVMKENSKTIIAVHGAGMNSSVWETLSLPVLALSLPGHSETEESLLPSVEEMSAWIKAQLSKQAPASVVLMGHSMGALAAMEAAKHPAVAAIILLGAAEKMPVHPDLIKQAAENPGAAADMILKWGVFSGNPEAEALRASLKKQMATVPAKAISNDLHACAAYQGTPEIPCPALVVAGEHDKLTRAGDGKALAEKIKAKFHLIPGCGHMPMAEKPEELRRIILDFIEAG